MKSIKKNIFVGLFAICLLTGFHNAKSMIFSPVSVTTPLAKLVSYGPNMVSTGSKFLLKQYRMFGCENELDRICRFVRYGYTQDYTKEDINKVCKDRYYYCGTYHVFYFTGMTPLHFACERGCTEIVKALIKNGADIHKVVEDSIFKGMTPLHIACREGRTEIVEVLIKNGADIHKVVEDSNFKGMTPLHFACERGCTEIVEVLIKNGADINKVGINSMTPLHLACERGRTEIVKVLIKNGADINKVVGYDGYFPPGMTPLHIACQEGRTEVVRALIENGADIDMAVSYGTRQGWTPLAFACKNGNIDLISLLLFYDAKINRLCLVNAQNNPEITEGLQKAIVDRMIFKNRKFVNDEI